MAVSNLTQRALIIVVFGPVFVGLFWLGGPSLLIGLCIVLGLGAREFFQIQQNKGLHPWTLTGVVASLACCGWAYRFGTDHLVVLLLFLVLTGLCLSLARNDGEFRTGDAAATLIGVLYVGFLGSFALLLRGTSGVDPLRMAGRGTVLLVLVGIWGTDIGAYLAGRSLGKRHPFPNISPKKTGAGLVGGLAGSVVVVAVGQQFVEIGPTWMWGGLAVLVFVGSVIGDLFESVLKRDAGVKDSGTLIPGHGGVLDRFDSFLFVFPTVYLYLELLEAIGTR